MHASAWCCIANFMDAFTCWNQSWQIYFRRQNQEHCSCWWCWWNKSFQDESVSVSLLLLPLFLNISYTVKSVISWLIFSLLILGSCGDDFVLYFLNSKVSSFVICSLIDLILCSKLCPLPAISPHIQFFQPSTTDVLFPCTDNALQ